MDAKTPLIITYHQSINPATALPVDCPVFVVPPGAEYELIAASEVHTVAGSDGSAVTAQVRKAPAGTAPASGTALLSTAFDLKSTANTPVNHTRASGIVNQATRRITGGQMLSIDFGGTLTALAGCCITLTLKMVRPPTYR